MCGRHSLDARATRSDYTYSLALQFVVFFIVYSCVEQTALKVVQAIRLGPLPITDPLTKSGVREKNGLSLSSLHEASSIAGDTAFFFPLLESNDTTAESKPPFPLIYPNSLVKFPSF